MAEAIVGPLLSSLQEVAVKEGKALAGVGKEIDRLREKLMWVHALVHETDIRNRSEGNQLVRVLSRQMREIAFEAEDAVDHFFLEVDLSRFGRDWVKATRMFFTNFGTQIWIRGTLSRKIKSMNARLEDIHDNNAKYNSNNESTGVITWRASRYIPPVRHNWDDQDLEESNISIGKDANPTKGSRRVKETQTDKEKGNGSATKGTGNSARRGYNPPPRKDDQDLEESNISIGKEATPTKGSPRVKETQAEKEKGNGSATKGTGNSTPGEYNLRPRKDHQDLEESNMSIGEEATPTKGSPRVKETQTEKEKGNGSATKGTGNSTPRGYNLRPRKKKAGVEESDLKKTPTKGKALAEEKQMEQERADQQVMLEEKQRKEGKLARKGMKEALMKHLLDEKEAGMGISVVYVVGESGMGKRYLIKKVYDTIKEEFQLPVWASFPPDTSDIADQTIRFMEEKCSEKLGKKELCKVKYLLVLDCPMSSAMLGSIIAPFPGGAPGSKIVVTATTNPPNKIGKTIKLDYLDKPKRTKLFNDEIGLGGRRKTGYKTDKMNTVRDHIEEITNGLPLAVILLAKLMRTMNYNKWEGASNYVMNNNQDDLLKTIVAMGMDDLPDELKSCLLYMAGFPDRSKIDARQLVHLWIAEGFLTQQLGVEPEEVGQRYLKELIFRGLVKLERKKKEGDVVELVSIRDQIHQFFRWEAQSTGFMETYYGGSSVVPDSTRRLALNSRNLPNPDKMMVLEKLRTVLLSHDDGQNHDAQGTQSFKGFFTHLFTNSTFLRVISLEGIDIGEKLPRKISSMVHLQYLGVRCPTLTTVPDSIGKLKKLQFMDVRGTKVETLPNSIWKIESLHHVICDKDLGYKGDKHLMLIIPPTNSSSGHITMG